MSSLTQPSAPPAPHSTVRPEAAPRTHTPPEAFRSAAHESRALRTSVSLKQPGRSTYGNAQGSWEVQVKQLGLWGASRGRCVHTASTETRREAACRLRAARALLGGQRARAWDRWAPRPVRRPASAVGTQEHAGSLTRPRAGRPRPRPSLPLAGHTRWVPAPKDCPAGAGRS